MRNSFTSMPRAPMRGDTVAPKKAMGFGALAEERVAKHAQVPKVQAPKPVQAVAQAAKPPANMLAPAQAPKQMQVQKPEAKAPGGMTGDYRAPAQKPDQTSADVRGAALQKFGQRIQDPNAIKKATTPDMAGQKPIRGAYVASKYPTINPSDLPDVPKVNMEAVDAYKASIDETQNPGPGNEWDAKFKNPDGSQGRWVKTALDEMPPGVALDDPGWYYTKDGWVYDPNVAGGKAIDDELAQALKGKPEDYGMSEELKAKAKQSLLNQAAQAKADLSQSMAGRGLGASGLTGAGFGQIDVGTQMALTDMEVQNWQAGVDARINELKTLLTARGNELSEKNRREIADQISELEKAKFEYEQSSQEESDRHTLLNNLIAQLGGEQWDPDALSWAYSQLDKGMSYADVIKALVKNSGDTIVTTPSALEDVLANAADADAAEMEDFETTPGLGNESGDVDQYYQPTTDPASVQGASEARLKALYDEYVKEADEANGDPFDYNGWLAWNVFNAPGAMDTLTKAFSDPFGRI